MTPLASFTVLGVPAPQGNKSAVMIGGKARLIEGRRASGRASHKAWRQAVAQAAHDAAGDEPLEGPLAIDVVFRFPRPQSRPKKHHGWHVVRPDHDKVLRATFDGLTDGGLVRDDCLFAAITVHAIEEPGWSGASIVITRLLPREPLVREATNPEENP